VSIELPLLYSGKVRDIYDAGDDRLFMVTSDRLSAFDVVMAEAVPDKGRVLTAMSCFWFEHLADLAPSHLISADVATFPVGAQGPEVIGRSMYCRRAEMLHIECIVRGYLSGSAWKEYRTSGTMHTVALPSGLRESDRLPEPVFTPSTKAAAGHDVNVSFGEAVNVVGREVAEAARDLSVALYTRAASHALARGIIIADTKFELGFIDGRLTVADEVLTPDSSRFWAVDDWRPGSTPASFDKQPVRDYLETVMVDGRPWNKTPPPPALPASVVAATRARYVEAYERITGRNFAEWPGGT
jgi:phosphoribosylaminoimidazole-succinocarboxamide synthase